MIDEELEALVRRIQSRKCEEQNIEVKEARLGTPKKLYDTISAFANQSGGGVIVFGISEADNFSVTGIYDVQDLQSKVVEQCKQMTPQIHPFFTVAEIEGKFVVSAIINEVESFHKPCFYNGLGRLKGSFLRVGDADIKMSEYEVYSYEAFKQQIRDEIRVVEFADMEAINGEALNGFFVELKKLKPNLQNMTKQQLLNLQGITKENKPTIAGLMMFGLYPQGFFPQLGITAIRVSGTELIDNLTNERFIDNKRIDGTIIQMIDEALAFIRRNMQVSTVVDSELGIRHDETEYPIRAIREIILNALIHRDYSVYTDGSPIKILMFRDRIEVENPGGLYGRITLDNLGKVAADTRNPFIASALEVMNKTENRFSGIPTIIAEMKAASLPPPVFESKNGAFKVTLFNKLSQAKVVMEASAAENTLSISQKILKFCSIPRTKEELSLEFNFSSPYLMKKFIRPMLDSGEILMTIPDIPKSKYQKYIRKTKI